MRQGYKYIFILIISLIIIYTPNVAASTVNCTYQENLGANIGYYNFEFNVDGNVSTLTKITQTIKYQDGRDDLVTTITDRTLSDFQFNSSPITEAECPTQIKTNTSNASMVQKTSDSTTTDNSWLLSDKVSCGSINNIPSKLPEITSMVVNVLQFVIPVILVIMGAIDLVKGVMSGKEDEIKKGQQSFIKRLTIGAIIFFIIALTKLLIGIMASGVSESNGIIQCIDCFTKGSSHCN